MQFPGFYKFIEILEFPRNRGPFFAHAPKRCYYKGILMVFLVISARIAFFTQKSCNSANYREFHQISRNYRKFSGIHSFLPFWGQ